MNLDFNKGYKPFHCAHTPRSNYFFPVILKFLDLKKSNSVKDCKWYYRIWIYTWVGQWHIDIDGGRIK